MPCAAMPRAALLGAALLASSSAFVTAPRRPPPRLPPARAVGRAAAAATPGRRRFPAPWRRRTHNAAAAATGERRAAAATGERRPRRRRRKAAAAALAVASALLCFRGTAAAAMVEGTKALIGKTVSDVGLGESLRALGMAGPRRDALALLLATATVVPLAKLIGLSPILGFLVTGVYLGPSGLNFISSLHQTEVLAELGVVFFLFEMGLELSVAKIGAMKTEIFGLGLAQFVGTTAIVAKAAQIVGKAVGSPFSTPSAIAVGGALALSSSAFVLQLLKDNEDTGTSHGRASLGVLLFQDLAVVPLLVLIPLLASGDGGLKLAGALAGSVGKAVFAVASVEIVGKRLISALFDRAKRSRSQEAFLSVVLLSVLGISAFTEAVGLSATLGAFLAGVSLAETSYANQVEASIAPLRGLLLGLFFVTVGFSIDVSLLTAQPVKMLGLAGGLVALKGVTLGGLGALFRLPTPTALRTGALCAQSGEFAFVAFALAKRLGLITSGQNRVLLTTVALSMAATPAVASLGDALAKRRALPSADDSTADLDRFRETLAVSTSSDDEFAQDLARRVKMKDIVVVLGYGAIGKVVCEMLDAKLARYVVLEKDAQKAEQAREAGRPVFRGDATDPDVLDSYMVGDARLVVAAIAESKGCTAAVVALKRKNARLPILARAADAQHKRRLARLPNVQAVVPTIQSDSKLLSLPFGGAVLRGLGFRADDVDMLIEENRRTALGFFDAGVATPAKPKAKLEKEVSEEAEKVPIIEEATESEEEEAPAVAAPKSLMEEVGVEVLEEEKVEEKLPINTNTTSTAAEAPAAEPEEVREQFEAAKPGSLEAQQGAFLKIAELQREAFFAADARAEELLDAMDAPAPANATHPEAAEILPARIAGLEDDQCTVMSSTAGSLYEPPSDR